MNAMIEKTSQTPHIVSGRGSETMQTVNTIAPSEKRSCNPFHFFPVC